MCVSVIQYCVLCKYDVSWCGFRYRWCTACKRTDRPIYAQQKYSGYRKQGILSGRPNWSISKASFRDWYWSLLTLFLWFTNSCTWFLYERFEKQQYSCCKHEIIRRTNSRVQIHLVKTTFYNISRLTLGLLLPTFLFQSLVQKLCLYWTACIHLTWASDWKNWNTGNILDHHLK